MLCMKTEVYSWRVSADLKLKLESEARRRKISLSAARDVAAQEWLKKRSADQDDAARQQRLQRAAAACLGKFASGNPRRAESARSAVRERFRRETMRPFSVTVFPYCLSPIKHTRNSEFYPSPMPPRRLSRGNNKVR